MQIQPAVSRLHSYNFVAAATMTKNIVSSLFKLSELIDPSVSLKTESEDTICMPNV